MKTGVCYVRVVQQAMIKTLTLCKENLCHDVSLFAFTLWDFYFLKFNFTLLYIVFESVVLILNAGAINMLV